MKTLKKVLVSLSIIGLLFTFPSQTADACSKTKDCYATGTYLKCGYTRGRVTGSHLVVEPNGYSSWCTVTIVSGEHTRHCDGCDEILGYTNTVCHELHSHEKCYDRQYMCK